MSVNCHQDEKRHLKDKIEIIYKYNPSYVPEYLNLNEDDSLDRINEIYRLGLSRVHEENYKITRGRFAAILPLFEVVEQRQDDPTIIMASGLILMSVQGTIKGHLETLSNLEHRNSTEEECLILCQKISLLDTQHCKEFFSLFKEYIILLMDNQKEITAPLSFEDPSKLVNEVYNEGSSEIIPTLSILTNQTCRII